MHNKGFNLNQERRIFLLVLGIFILVTTVYFVTTKVNTKASASWWHGGWLYRKQIEFTNSGSPITAPRKIKVDVDTTTLINSNKMQTDCDDVRFIDQSGKPLDYFIDTATAACNTSSTDFYVKLPQLPSGKQVIYLYYGNLQANRVRKNDFFDSGSLGSGLKGYWKMDDNVSGGSQTILDYATNKNGLTYDGNSTLNCSASAKVGSYSCQFDGTDDRISLTNLGVNTTAGGKNTVTFWMYWNGVQGKMPFGWTSYDLWTQSNCFGFNTGQNNILGISTSSVPANTWVHVAAVFYNGVPNATDNEIYINGSKQTLTACLYSTTNSMFATTNATIGNWNRLGAYYYGGKLDDFRIYNRNLSESEVANIYNSGAGSEINSPLTYSPATEPTLNSEETTPGPVAYWKVDEGQGSSVRSSTANQKNGTLTGAPDWKPESECVSGNCLYYNGSDNDYVEVTDSGSTDILDLGTASFSVSYWGKAIDYTYPKSLFPVKDGNAPYNTGTGHEGWSIGDIYVSTGQQIVINDGVNKVTSNLTFNSGSQPPDLKNRWVFYTYVFDRTNGQVKVFINGVQQTSTVDISSVTGSISNTTNLQVGFGTGWKTHGYLDEFKIYPYARTAAQIKADYTGKGAIKGISASMGSNPQNAAALSDGLVGYWKLDEASENSCSDSKDTCDSSGNNNHGAWSGTFTAGAGKFGNAGSFIDGASRYIDFGDPTTYDFGSSNFSISVWFNRSEIGSWDGNLINKWNTGGSLNTNEWALGAASGSSDSLFPGFTINSGSTFYTATSNEQAALNKWHHLVGIRNNDYIYLYLNGSEKAKIYIGSVAVNNVNGRTLKIAKIDGGSYGFIGQIDETRVYNRALSPSEVRQLYEWAPGPIAYYDFEATSGTTVYDRTNNNHNGTIQNGATLAQGKYGKAIALNLNSNSNQYISISDYAHNNAFTKMAWIKPTSISGCPETRCSILSQYFEIAETSLQYYDNYLSTPGWHTGGTITLNQWQHATVSYDGINLKLYLNGREVKSVALSNTGDHATGIIGAYTSHIRNFKGYIDEVKVYNYARTSKQIIEDMNAGHPLGGSPAGSKLIHYKFEENSIDYAYNSGTGGSTYHGNLAGSCPGESTCPSRTPNGKVGRALVFDGNDYFTSGTYLAGTSDHTYSAWFNLDKSVASSSQNYPIFGSNQAISVLGYNPVNKQFAHFRQYSTGSQSVYWTVTPQYADSQWHHVLISISQQSYTVKLYIDGKYVGVKSIGTEGYTHSNSAFVYVGRNYSYYWLGLLDEMNVYGAALNEDEVKIDYNQGAAIVLGSTSNTAGLSGGSVASSSASAEYCIPGDTATCSPPVAEWKLDEGKDGYAYDTSGNNNLGTISGATWTKGKIGKALSFDGTDDYVSISGFNGVNNSSSLTICALVYLKSLGTTDDIADGGIFTNDSVGPPTTLLWYNVNAAGTGNHTYSFLSGNTGSTNDRINGTDNIAIAQKWQYVCGIIDGSARKLYVDGSLNNSGTGASTITVTLDDINARIGSWLYTPNFSFDGFIDNIKIYNYARTPAQIAWDYNRGKPVGWWKLDECQGTTAYDSSGNGNTGTITAGDTSGTNDSTGTCSSGAGDEMWSNGAAGKLNSSLHFDGTNDYISITDQARLRFGTSNFSISAWIKANSNLNNTHRGIYHKGYDGTSPGEFSFYVAGDASAPGKLRFIRKDSYYLTGNRLVADNQWHHVMAIRDSDQLFLYVDGKLDNSDSEYFQNIDLNNTYDVKIGHRDSTRYFNGQIDDVQIFNYALTPEQIKIIYNSNSAMRF